MSKVQFLNDVGVKVAVGEPWIDRRGHSCYFRDNGTICSTVLNDEPSLTIQAEKDSCDVNLIVAKYAKTGVMGNVRTDQPMYGDFSSAVDYHDALIKIQEAEESFMSLPANVRKRFENDPGKLIDFLQDVKNREEAISLGLVVEAPQASQMPQGASPQGVDSDTPPVVPLT